MQIFQDITGMQARANQGCRRKNQNKQILVLVNELSTGWFAFQQATTLRGHGDGVMSVAVLASKSFPVHCNELQIAGRSLYHTRKYCTRTRYVQQTLWSVKGQRSSRLSPWSIWFILTSLDFRAAVFNVNTVTSYHIYKYIHTSSTAQGGGGSFRNRKPIGEVRCCESRMAERSHWWTDRWLRSPLFLSLSFSFSDYLPTYLPIYLPTYLSIYLSSYLSIYLSIYLASYLSIYLLSIYLSTYLSIYLSIFLSIYLSIYLSNLSNLSVCLSFHLSIYLPLYLSIYLSTYLPSNLSTYLPIHLSICLSIYLILSYLISFLFSSYFKSYLILSYLILYIFYSYLILSIYPSISLYLSLSIYLPIYLSI